MKKKESRADSPESAAKILRITPIKEAFYFFSDIGQYTGIFARSLEEFYEKISSVPLKSLEFHFARGDFEKWIKEILGDMHLAKTINSMDKSLKAEKLRTMLKRNIRRRINYLKKIIEKHS